MALERRSRTPRTRTMSMPARLVIGALAVFGAISLVQWVLTTVLSVVKFGLLVVVVVGVGAWIVGAKSSR